MKAHGQPPATGTFVTGAGAVDGLVEAIKRAKGSTSGPVLAAILEKFRNVPTIAGPVTFSPKLHSVFGRPYRVIEVENSKPKYVGTIKASSPASLG